MIITRLVSGDFSYLLIADYDTPLVDTPIVDKTRMLVSGKSVKGMFLCCSFIIEAY